MPLYVFAAEIYKMLFVSGGRILLKSFESKYESTFTKNLDVNDFGANSLIDLLHMIDFTVTIIISWNRLTVQLNENLSGKRSDLFIINLIRFSIDLID